VTTQPPVVAADVSFEPSTYQLRFLQPAALRAIDGSASRFLFDIRHVFSIAPGAAQSPDRWQIEPRRYEYGLLDRSQRELLVYHWHPESIGPDYPHLHVSASLNVQVDALTRRSIDLDKLHIVTGPVTLQSFIRMLITEFQIRPLRPDWGTRLNEAATH
jgi:hypothetical protein